MCMVLSTMSVLAKLPPLPTWNAEDKERLRKGEIVVGIGLLTDELEKQATEKPPEVEVIIEAVQAKPNLPGTETLSDEAVISDSYLEKYFGGGQDTRLVDPQQLLSMQEREDMKYALAQHEEESEVPIYVYLFDAKQKLPKGYSPEEIYDRVFTDKDQPSVLVYYFLGTPERTEFLLVGGASDEVPEWQVRELLWNSTHKAREKSAVFDQLDVFVGQLSMRLFWVEEILEELKYQIPDEVKMIDQEPESASKVEKLIGSSSEAVKPHLRNILVGTAGGILVLVCLVWFFLGRRYKFPESPSPERLGGSVGGKSGGILRYRSSRLPPSQQRKQFEKDFL